MNSKPSFKTDILPLFTERDIEGMRRAFDLTDYKAVKAHAQAIHDRIRGIGGAVVPPPLVGDGPWPQSNIDVFERWLAEGYPDFTNWRAETRFFAASTTYSRVVSIGHSCKSAVV
jgi:hypothetical protein